MKKGFSIIEMIVVITIIGVLLKTIISSGQDVIKKTETNAYFSIMDKMASKMCPDYIISNSKGNVYVDYKKKNSKIKVPTVKELINQYHLSLSYPFYTKFITKQPTISYNNGNCVVYFEVNKDLFNKYKSIPVMSSNLIISNKGNQYGIKLISPIVNGLSASLLREPMFYQYINRGLIYPGTFQKKNNDLLKSGTDILMKLPWNEERAINRFKDAKGRIVNRNEADLKELPYYNKTVPKDYTIINNNHYTNK